MTQSRDLRVSFHARTDPGMRRKVNEDAFLAEPVHAFCIVCDGMGGHASGEVAATMAVDLIGERLRAAVPPVAGRGVETIEPLLGALPEVLADAVREANDAIHARGSLDPRIESGRSMGTTLLVMAFAGEKAFLAHIGDSRIYRIRGGSIEALTRDHSVTAHQAASGERPARRRKFVTRALGTRAQVLPEIRQVDVEPGDFFVLCSDGLTDYVQDDELCRFLTWIDADELPDVPKQLVSLANKRGGRDNITVVIAAVEGSAAAAAAPSDTSAGWSERTQTALAVPPRPPEVPPDVPASAPDAPEAPDGSEPDSDRAARSEPASVPTAPAAASPGRASVVGPAPTIERPTPFSDFAPPPEGRAEHRELDPVVSIAAPPPLEPPPPLDPQPT